MHLFVRGRSAPRTRRFRPQNVCFVTVRVICDYRWVCRRFAVYNNRDSKWKRIVFRTSFGRRRRCRTPRDARWPYTRARAASCHCDFVSRESLQYNRSVSTYSSDVRCAGVHEQNANEFSFNMRLMSPADCRPSGAAAGHIRRVSIHGTCCGRSRVLKKNFFFLILSSRSTCLWFSFFDSYGIADVRREVNKKCGFPIVPSFDLPLDRPRHQNR